MGKSKSKKTEASPENEASNSDGTAPTARPGTSGTENLLITNRRQASEQFAKASRAEKAYRTKKQAALARANYNETKTHFREAFSHFKLAFKGLYSVLKSVNHLVGEKREIQRQAAENKKREKNLELKKKLDEALAKEEANEDGAKQEKTPTE
ncbi:hypothetical protein FALBO_8489 [Fusarium albosuccineum]|uniref:Uncharacterized protein n=1 Tax=Fusarium albosuccineum TaxID=1237068 RepID=A0A8H4L9G2_9HYPO|nr:hypothetical protein FALBO_8489 [Fusarium albosuccineum]